MGSYHAALSPSSAHRWTECTASVPATAGHAGDSGSDAARIGTCCHAIAAHCLLNPEHDLQEYLDRVMIFGTHPETGAYIEQWRIFKHSLIGFKDVHEVVVTQEMLDGVYSALQFIREQISIFGGKLLIEQSVPIGHITGEHGATGSADVILLSPKTLRVYDFKFGRHKVYAYDHEAKRPNLQMSMYALGALESHGLFYAFEAVQMTIVQTMLSPHHLDSHTCSLTELQDVRRFVSMRAQESVENPTFRPSFKVCQWCRLSGQCPAQTEKVLSNALEGFNEEFNMGFCSPDEAKINKIQPFNLGDCYALIPLVKKWADDVERTVKDNLASGVPVKRSDGLVYKLVEGRATARSWKDEAEAERALQECSLLPSEYQKVEIISPTQAEALAKVPRAKKGELKQPAKLNAEQWQKLQEFITQGKAQPAIALETDPRPAIADATAGFTEDNSDLF